MKNRPGARRLVVSVDVDSPGKLLKFYRLAGVEFGQEKLESFYRVAWDRALAFFHSLNIRATFFVVGDEIEGSEAIQNVILQAHRAGHEIENHSYSHPFGLASLPSDRIREEIRRCNQVVEKVTGVAPIGFRSPGYNVNSKVINIAAELGLKYDSSGFWSVMNLFLKSFHGFLFKNGLSNPDFGFVTHKLRQDAYRPSQGDWLVPDPADRPFLELPFPRTNLLRLPFYNNFNLWAPAPYSQLVSRMIVRPYVMYLFHIIEFMDLSDGIPAELSVHPNVRMSVRNKEKKSRAIVSRLMDRYEWVSGREFVGSHLNTVGEA